MIPTLYIVRGVPGSGKSTFAKKLAAQHRAEHFEADMYFMRNGVYEFDRRYLPAAHEWCYREVESALWSNVNVVVSNTFTTQTEMEDYLVLTEKMLWPVQIWECMGKFQNIHNVPEPVLQRMRDRFVPNDRLERWKHVNYFKHVPVVENEHTANQTICRAESSSSIDAGVNAASGIVCTQV